MAGDGGPAIFASLASPQGLSPDGLGSLFIADNSNNAVRAVDPGGVIRTVAGTLGVSGFSGATFFISVFVRPLFLFFSTLCLLSLILLC